MVDCNHEYQTIVGENIRGYRTKLGWTQEKLAVRAKVHYNYIGNLERGERNIGLVKLAQIAKALNVPIYLLLKPNSFNETENTQSPIQ